MPHYGPCSIASGSRGLKSLAAARSLLMCLSSVMPASWRQVCDREGTLLSVLNPASVSRLEYIGRPMEISQSDTEVISPGDTGFRQISVSPPLGIWAVKKKTKKTTLKVKHSCLFYSKSSFVFSSKLVEFHNRCFNFSHVTFVSMRAVWVERLRSLGTGTAATILAVQMQWAVSSCLGNSHVTFWISLRSVKNTSWQDFPGWSI